MRLRVARSQVSAAPIRSTVVGWVPNRNWTQPGGSGSATFWSASLRSTPMNAAGCAVERQRVRVGRRLDLARQRVAGMFSDEPDTSAIDSAAAGQHRRPGAARRRSPPARSAASAA